MSTPNGDEEPREGLSTGAIVGLIFFALVIIVGGLCLWLFMGVG